MMRLAMVLAFGASVVGCCCEPGGKGSNRSSSPSVLTPSCSTGSKCKLVAIGGDKGVALFATKEIYDRVTEAAAKKDLLGYFDLITVLAKPGTKVQIIDIGFERYRVRIVEGERIGFAGWVSRESVKPL